MGHLTADRSNIGGPRKYLGWRHIRLSVVVPIGIIVAVAIVCVVVAALSAARRADDVALDNERQLLTHALTSQGERVLRDIAAVANSEAAYRRIRVSFDSDWVQISVGLRLQSFFEHDFVFVTDPFNHFLYASLGRRSVDPSWFNSVQSELRGVLDVMRGRTDPGDGLTIDATAEAYAKRLLGLDSMKEWYAAGIKETIRDLPHEREMLQMGTVLQDLRAR